MANNEARNLNMQHNTFIDMYNRMAGSGLKQALKNKYFVDRLINNKMHSYCLLLGDDTIAQYRIKELDRERALIDMREFEAMLESTNDAVKEAARAAIEEAVDDFIKDFS